MREDPLTTAIKALVPYFEEHNIDYVFVGGLSVILTGRVRMTMNLDLIVDHTKLDHVHFTRYLQENNIRVFLSDFDNFSDNLHVNIYLKDSMFRIDIKGTYTENDKRAIKMAITSVYNGIPVKINHPLNTVAYKLYFGSEQDYEDALAVFVRNEELIDIDELRRICEELDVGDKLEEFLQEVEDLK